MDFPGIPDEEFTARITKLQIIMREQSIDLLLAYGNEAEPQFIRYFSDYWPSFETAGVLIGQYGEPQLIIGPESLTFASDRSRIKNIRRIQSFRESSNPEYPGELLDTFEDVIQEVIPTGSINTAAVAGYGVISHIVFSDFRESLIKIGVSEIVNGDDLVMKLRMVKSENEIACMRKAASISYKAMEYVIQSIRPGMTELQVRGLACSKIYELGGENEAYPMWVLSGKGGDQAISRARQNPIGSNELVHIGIGARYEGYASSIGRQVITGKAEDWMLRAINAAYEAHDVIGEQLYAGNNARNVAAAYYAVMEKNGYREWLLYGPCHGSGLMEGEPPWIESNSDYVLLENMTFCIDIFMFNREAYGFRVEDSVRVGASGMENLTNYPKDINVI